jgi:predicted nuclease of predicted toxin-antitoxin system
VKFTVDESTGKAVAEYLRAAGHDVLFVAEQMPEADDPPILTRTFSEGRILITNDKDFGELVHRLGQVHHGVLLLRLRNESPTNRVRVVKTVLEQHADRLADHFVVAAEGGVRIRPAQTLP